MDLKRLLVRRLANIWDQLNSVTFSKEKTVLLMVQREMVFKVFSINRLKFHQLLNFSQTNNVRTVNNQTGKKSNLSWKKMHSLKDIPAEDADAQVAMFAH